jgi:tight adherence protein B
MDVTPVALASCCAAVLAWLMFKPAPARLRLNRLLAPTTAHERGVRKQLLVPATAGLESFRERRRMRRRWREAVIALCDGMASELAAGRTPDEAFTITAALLDPPIATHLLDAPPQRPKEPPAQAMVGKALTPGPAARSGTPTEQATGPPDVRPSPRERLDDLARLPGAEGLRLLAACWRIGAEQGGTLAAVLDDLATALRDEEANRQEIATQLAGPRATARLLSGLPLLGLGMAAALGANPLAFLFGTAPGLGCLFAGVTLNSAGLWWTHRLAKAAEEIP